MSTGTVTHPASLPSLQILHLEDNPADCTLVQATVSQAGPCTFTTVDNQAAFLRALQSGGFDLILADYTLQGYDGSAALADARRLQPDTPFIFVSGTLGEERVVEILQEGATDCVLKDRLGRLVPSIHRALRSRQEQAERRRIEQALRDSEERFREMAENIREVFWAASADGRRVLYASPAYEIVWNRPVAELVARPESWLDSIVLDDRARVELAREMLATGTPYNLEYRILLPEGGHRWIEERAYPVPDERGRVQRTVGVALDITERKELAKQLQQAQKMEAIGQLAGGIAHDFSNMLTIINGYSSLLLDHPEVPPAVAQTLRQIYVAGGRAASLTRQLLIFSRRSNPHTQPADLNEVVDEAATMLRRMIGEHIRLELDLARPLPHVLADTGMIDQVLMNLVVNARDAMPRGGSLVISTGSCEITAADCRQHPDARPGPHVWLSVRDTGCGIAPEILPRIFEPFFTTKEAGRGTGLGLATVFGIIRQHHGWIEVESEVGTGTMFRFFLPVATAGRPAGQSGEPSHAPFAPEGQEVILLVEDEDAVREYARTVLEMHGYKVLQAASGAGALEAWKWHQQRIALVVTDVVLPDDLTGRDLAARFRADRPGLPVLLTSGYGPEFTGQNPGDQTEFRFIHKPYQPKTLARLVRELLDARPRHANAPPA
jgi:PAS domain S-box-containing protein